MADSSWSPEQRASVEFVELAFLRRLEKATLLKKEADVNRFKAALDCLRECFGR